MTPPHPAPSREGAFFTPGRNGQGRYMGSQALADFRLGCGVYVRHTSVVIPPFFANTSKVVRNTKLALASECN